MGQLTFEHLEPDRSQFKTIKNTNCQHQTETVTSEL